MRHFAFLAALIAGSLISHTVAAASCEHCPLAIWHCETMTPSTPPPNAPAYEWLKLAGPGAFKTRNGLSVRRYDCGGNQQGAWSAAVFLYPGGKVTAEIVGGLCGIIA